MKRALVIDSSIFARKNFTTVLKKAGYEVTTAGNARSGLRMAASIKPELVTLDIGIADMNGLECLEQLTADKEWPVVVTAEPGEHSNELAKAVRVHGAAAAIQKPSAWDIIHDARAVDDLITTISRATMKPRRPGARTVQARPVQQKQPLSSTTTARPAATAQATTAKPVSGHPAFRPPGPNFPIYLIGSSTGGPNALQAILPLLTADFPAAIVIAQHMPKRFTFAFAKRMAGLMSFPAHEAAAPTEVKSGNCYIAAGGADCVFSNRNGKVFISPEPPEEGSLWCPSVDRMVDSAIKSVPAKRLRGIQLTGIGNDGARAMNELHKLGSQVIAESKESSVVFGMPGNLISMGGASKVLHHRDIAKAMLATVQR